MNGTTTTSQTSEGQFNNQDTFKQLFNLIKEAIQATYNIDVSSEEASVVAKFEPPKELVEREQHDYALPGFALAKALAKAKPATMNFNQFAEQIAKDIASYISNKIQQNGSDILLKVEQVGPYMNFFCKASYLAKVIGEIINGSFVNKRSDKKVNVMIEYSQPNTHKTFHVGHMRNAALGNSLVLLFEFMGYNVVAANYIGDVGAHIAKCLWYYIYHSGGTGDIEKDAPEGVPKVEWLGDMYQLATEYLDFSLWTKYPFAGLVTAQVKTIADHPTNKAWKVVTVFDGKEDHQVVCGGKGYKEGDIIAFARVGVAAAGRMVKEQDMKGVTSRGMILSEKELELENGNKDKIHILPAGTPVGAELTEVGRVENKYISKETHIATEMKARTAQVNEVLSKMEAKDPYITKTWEISREWCLQDFKKIYSWVNCRFDHYFHESDVGDESKQIVKEGYEKGLLTKSEGTIGADLSKWKLGYCMLLTSAGNGLYATKDLALAKRKFEEFKIDRSIYVVDASQSLHFQQVFKTLEVLGFKQAEKCYHLAYGLVVLPDGKMSSRKGNIITFSQLQKLLTAKIYQEYTSNHIGKEGWTEEEINEVTRKVAVGTIKYGMLNQDNKKDIVFDLNEWTSRTGNTGPYLMYAYARLKSILRKIELTEEETKLADWALLDHESERALLGIMKNFADVVEKATEQYRPQLMCIFLYELAKQVSRMYEAVPVKNAPTPALKATRTLLVDAAGRLLKVGLNLLGIETCERM